MNISNHGGAGRRCFLHINRNKTDDFGKARYDRVESTEIEEGIAEARERVESAPQPPDDALLEFDIDGWRGRDPAFYAEMDMVILEKRRIACFIRDCRHEFGERAARSGNSRAADPAPRGTERTLVEEWDLMFESLYPSLVSKCQRQETLRRFFGALVENAICESGRRLERSGAASVEDIRGAGRTLISFSEGIAADLGKTRKFLFASMYKAPEVLAVRESATEIIRDLFPRYMDNIESLPEIWRDNIAAAKSDSELARIVADYIAGMTDPFAVKERGRLTGGETIASFSALPMPEIKRVQHGSAEEQAARAAVHRVHADLER